MKTEIILHFVITQQMLLKAGIYMIFFRVVLLMSFFLPYQATVLSSCWFSGMVELLPSLQLTQCHWCQQAMLWLHIHHSDAFIFPSWPAPKYLQAKVKMSYG